MPKDEPVRGYIIGGPVYDTAGSQHTMDELQALADGLGPQRPRRLHRLSAAGPGHARARRRRAREHAARAVRPRHRRGDGVRPGGDDERRGRRRGARRRRGGRGDVIRRETPPACRRAWSGWRAILPPGASSACARGRRRAGASTPIGSRAKWWRCMKRLTVNLPCATVAVGDCGVLHHQPDRDPGAALPARDAGHPLLRPGGLVRDLDGAAGVVGVWQRQAQQGAPGADVAARDDHLHRRDGAPSVHELDARGHRAARVVRLGDGAALLGAGGRARPRSPGAPDDAAAHLQRRQRLRRRPAGVRPRALDAAGDVAPGDRVGVWPRSGELSGAQRPHRAPAGALRQPRCGRRSRHVRGAARPGVRDERVATLAARAGAARVVCRRGRDLSQPGPRLARRARHHARDLRRRAHVPAAQAARRRLWRGARPRWSW